MIKSLQCTKNSFLIVFPMVYLVHWIFTFFQTVELLTLKDTALSDEGLGG